MIGHQYWQIMSIIDEHTCHKTAHNRNRKTGWLINKFSDILKHNSYIKLSSLIDESIEIWGVKVSYNQAYRAKRKAMEFVQGIGIYQFTHLRSYAQELLKSNPNTNIVMRCADFNGNHVFETIYVCLESYKAGFAKTCMSLIGLDACFFERGL